MGEDDISERTTGETYMRRSLRTRRNEEVVMDFRSQREIAVRNEEHKDA